MAPTQSPSRLTRVVGHFLRTRNVSPVSLGSSCLIVLYRCGNTHSVVERFAGPGYSIPVLCACGGDRCTARTMGRGQPPNFTKCIDHQWWHLSFQDVDAKGHMVRGSKTSAEMERSRKGQGSSLCCDSPGLLGVHGIPRNRTPPQEQAWVRNAAPTAHGSEVTLDVHGVHVDLDSRRTQSAKAACPPPRNPPSSDRSTSSHRSCWEIRTYRAVQSEYGFTTRLTILSTRQGGVCLIQRYPSFWTGTGFPGQVPSSARELPACAKAGARFPVVVHDKTTGRLEKRTPALACHKYRAPISGTLSGAPPYIDGARVNPRVLVDICSCPRVCPADISWAISHSTFRERKECLFDILENE